ncbi:MAG: hypothetical protein J6B51_00495, partial [Clostridia bacterium]|nr:hypothetical protein [Clostridia bacterium]
LHFENYLIFTHNNEDGSRALFLRDIKEKTISALDFDIKSYAVSGKYLYFIGRDGTLSALDLENENISKHTFPSEIKEEIISIQPYGLEKVLFWALTYDDEQHVNGHVFKIADSEGIIEDSKYMSFSSPVYVTDFEYYQSQKSDETDNSDNPPVTEGSEEKSVVAFSIVCDENWNYSVAGVFDDGNVEELFGFGEEPVLDIDIDNGRLYVLLDDEIGYIDLASDKYEYTHLFYSDSHEGYNSFYRFAVHKGYIYLLYGVYDVGDVYVDRIAVTANSISEAERYQDCMLMDDIFIDKDDDLFYYYHAENEGLIPDVTSVYARDMKTNLSNRILSDTDMFRYFDGNISDFRLVKDLFVYTYTPDSGETHLCLLDLSTKQESIINFDIKSYSISGKYIYYIDSEGVLSAYDMEKDEIVGFTFPHQFDQEEVIIDSFGLEDVLVRAFTFNEDWSIKDSVYQIIYSDGNISESDKFRSSSAPVYITEPIVSSGPSDVLIEDKPISFGEKRFTELFENIASYIGKGIFDGNSMTDEDKFFLAYFFGECDGSNSEYGDIYPVDYIQNLLETHISEDYASRFEPKNVSFYNPATTSFLFPTDFKKSFAAKVEQSGIDDILNVYKYSSDGNNLERIYIASLSAYSSAVGEMSWKIDSYYEKLTETSSDLDTIGKHLFDAAVMSYGDTYKDFEYTSIVFDDNKTIVIGYDDKYIGFELFFSDNGLGIMSAELVDVEKYITKPIEPVPEESLKLNDLKEFEKYIIQAFRDGDHNLLNLLMGEQKYLSLPADPSISVATDTGYTELNIQIGENGYLYSRKLIDSASFNVLNYTESLAYCVEKANDRFYLRSFGIYVEPNVIYFDVENYISFPGTDKIPFTVSAESWKTCSNLNFLAEAIRVAIKNGDWNLIAEMGAGYSNEEQNGVTTIIPSLKIYREISSVVCSYVGGNEYRYDIETTDGQKETLYIVISKDYDGNNTLSVNRSSSYVAPVPVPIEPATEEIYDSDIAELFEKLHLYQKYAEYSSASMKVDSSVTDESGMYNKVIDEKYDTWDEWTAFVSSVFCGNYLTNTKNNDLYINVDGFTYCMQGGMGWYLSEDYTYNIVENNNSEVVIDITYKENSPTVGDEETYQTFRYVLQLTENGWRIADQLPV